MLLKSREFVIEKVSLQWDKHMRQDNERWRGNLYTS